MHQQRGRFSMVTGRIGVRSGAASGPDDQGTAPRRRARGGLTPVVLAGLMGAAVVVVVAQGQEGAPPASGGTVRQAAAKVGEGPVSEAGVVVIKVPAAEFVHRVQLSAERVGVVASVPREGDRVRRGEIVARLRDGVAVTMLAATKLRAESTAEVQAAQKAAEAERYEHTVMSEANKNRVANRATYTESDLQRALLRAEQAEAQVAVREHERAVYQAQTEQAQAELETYHLIAPFDGLVTRVLKQPGAGVQQSEGILELVNTEVIRVEAKAPLAAAYRLQVGQPVVVRFDIPTGTGLGPAELPREAAGALGFIDVSAEGLPGDYSVRVWAEVDNPGGRLFDGLAGEMRIVIGPPGAAAAIAAPDAAAAGDP